MRVFRKLAAMLVVGLLLALPGWATTTSVPLLTDLFSGTSGTSLTNPPWIGCGYSGGSYAVFLYQSGQAGGTGFSATDCAVYTGYSSMPNDQYATGVVAAGTPSSVAEAALLLRGNGSASTPQKYVACGWDNQDFSGSTRNYRIWSWASGASTPTSLYLSSTAPATNDLVWCQEVGMTVTLIVNGTTLGSATDTSGDASGPAGMYFLDPNTGAASGSDVIFKNFGAGAMANSSVGTDPTFSNGGALSQTYTSGGSQATGIVTQGSNQLWMIYPDAFGISGGSGTIVQSYVPTSHNYNHVINLSGLSAGGGVDAYPFIRTGCDQYVASGDPCMNGEGLSWPQLLTSMQYQVIDMNYAITGTLTGNQDLLFDDWICDSATPSDIPDCLEIIFVPYYRGFSPGASVSKTITLPVTVNGKADIRLFDEYLYGINNPANMILAPTNSGVGNASDIIRFDHLFLIKQAVADWNAQGSHSLNFTYEMGIELGDEFDGVSSQSFTLTLNKLGIEQTAVSSGVSLSSLSLNPTSVVGGSSSTGTVTLTGAAPTGGASVSLSSSSGSATVPSSVTVAAGSTSAMFTVTTTAVTSVTTSTIQGSYNGMASALLTINPNQLWAGILNTARAISWNSNNAGVVGGIPSANWTQSGSTISAGASAATINSALTSCAGANKYVLLGSGTFNLSSDVIMTSGCELRGQGPNSTFLVFSAGGGCGGLGAQICALASTVVYFNSTSVQPGGTNSATWCGTASSGACNSTYTQGATHIQLTNVGSTGITNGMFISLDQNDDNPATPSTSNTTGLLVCDNISATDGCSLEGTAPGRCSVAAANGATCYAASGVDRNLEQIVQVVSGCATACTGAGPFNITITPGIYGLKWASSYSPGAWWTSPQMTNLGVANLSIDSTAVGTTTDSGIYFYSCYNCWVNNVRSIKPHRNHVWLWASAHDTVQNSYFFGTQNAASQSYGVESWPGTDNLVINNIFQQVTTPIMMGPSLGSVFAYNFSIYNLATCCFLYQEIASNHDAAAMYNLYEGNIGQGFIGDYFHGGGGLQTFFRNVALGWDSTPTTSGTSAVRMDSYQRFQNVVGNVLGCNNTSSAVYPGNCGAPYQTSYQVQAGAGGTANIYDLGSGASENISLCGGGTCTVANDNYVATSMMRWGNYDTKNAANQFNSAEVPTALTDGYALSIPASHTLPASFYLSSKPSWWTSGKPWPAIGPDITGGNLAGFGGRAYSNPAMDCYFNVMGGPVDGGVSSPGNPLAYNPTSCYGGGSSGVPLAPTGLTLTVY